MKFSIQLRFLIVVCIGFLLLAKLSFSVPSAQQNERASPSKSSGASAAKPTLIVEPQLKGGERGIERALKSYGLLKLDARQLSEQVRRSGKLTLQTNQQSFDLDLEENNLLSVEYRAEEVAEGGRVRAVARPELYTYKGRVNGRDDTQARLTIAPQTFEGVIIAAGETYFIEPRQKNAGSGDSREFLFYKESDVIERNAATCGVTLEEKINHAAEGVAARHLKQIPERPLAENGNLLNREIELATEADFEYVTARGTSEAANAQIISIMNMVEGIFQYHLGLSFAITFQHSWATASDPYHSTVASSVLTEFQNHWNSNYASINRDVAHMWTGKELDDSTVGIAFLSVVCKSRIVSYGVSQDFFDYDIGIGITAHEIGHNLGATHPDEHAPPIESCADSIMQQTSGYSNSFCQFSLDEIGSYVNSNASCLTRTFIISGQVVGSTDGYNITMNLTGPRPSGITIFQDGKFSFPGLTAGTYTITPSHPFYTFNPSVQTINISNTNVSDITFTASVLAYNVAGRVRDPNNRGVGGIDIDLSGGPNGSLTVKTNQDGSYLFENLLVSRTYILSPRGNEYTFSPGEYEVNFGATSQFSYDFVAAPAAPPISSFMLLADDNSTRALAFDSVTRMREPFSVANNLNFSADQRTRVALFALNLLLLPGENYASTVTCQLEDAQGQILSAPVEYVDTVPYFRWLTQVIVRLPDEAAGRGELGVRLGLRGALSNKVMISVR